MPVLGRALRAYARRFPEGSVVEIHSGLAAGLLWKRHHRYVNGYWIGNYELDIQQALSRLLHEGNFFYDVGANAGFFTLLGSRLVGPTGRVFAFEPLPENVESIREQVEVNRVTNVEIVPMAVGAHSGTDTLFLPASNSMAHMGSGGENERSIQVRVITLDEFAATHATPSALKIDVEGLEGDVLRASSSLLEKRARFLIEVHGPEAAVTVIEALRSSGYVVEKLSRQRAGPMAAPFHIIGLPEISATRIG
jgi:FkbM family methyltransferase